MTTISFEYRAVDDAGKKRRGFAQAASKADAIRKVTAMGLTPVTVRASNAARRLNRSRSSALRAKDLAAFTYQLGVLISARIPLGEGLVSIVQQEKPGLLREIVTDIAQRVDAGETLASAMGAHRDQLGDVYVETIRAAETSGTLSKVLDHLSGMLERGQETTRQVWTALMYPLAVVTVLVLAVFFLIGFVVPKFARMFAQRGADLPVITKSLMAFGTSLQSYWWLYLIAALAAGFAARALWQTPRTRYQIDRVLHKVPVLKTIITGLAISRFARVLGITLASGLGLIECLTMAGRSSGRPILQRDVDRMVEQVRVGGRLTEVLGKCAYLTAFAKRMLTAGEQSAELSRMCDVVANHYERETSHATKNIGTLIEPVLIVGIAGVVLVIALAIFMPMWDMLKLVG